MPRNKSAQKKDRKKGRRRSRTSMASYKHNEDEMKSEVDKFHEQADHVPLAAAETSESDSEPELAPEGINMGVDESSSESEEEESENENVRELLREEEEAAVEEKRQRLAEEEEVMGERWGKKKSLYYSADTADFEVQSDEDAAKEEEEEARRLQQEEEEKLAAADYALPPKKKKKRKKKKKKKKKEETEEEVVEKDLKAVDTKAKFERILSDTPELLVLLEELKQSLTEVRTSVQPVLEKVRGQKLQTDKGTSFLEVKLHLLLNYCINIVFYMLLKSEGRPVKGHPVIEQLVKLRIFMEKLAPIGSKLKYQIDKLLRIAAQGKTAEATDPLQFKPRPSELTNEDVVAPKASAVYEPPRITAMPYDVEEKKSKRKQAREARLRSQASKSELVQELRQEFSERPEEIRTGEGRGAGSDSEEEKRRFEEDNFVRLVETREQKKRRNKRRNKSALAAEFSNFDDLTALTEMDLSRPVCELPSAVPEGAPAKRRRTHKGGKKLASAELEASNEYYEAMLAGQRKKLETRQSEHPKPESKYMAEDPDVKEGRRGATKKILKNAGLKRMRPKKKKTAHSRYRSQYESALKKRRSQVQEFKGSKQNAYEGEATGIKTNLVRSVNLRD